MKKHTNPMAKYWAGLLCSGLLIWGTGINTAAAAYVNPFTATPAIRLSSEEKEAYLDQKTKAMFSSPAAQKTEPYVPPAGWRQDVISLKSLRLEKYTSDKWKWSFICIPECLTTGPCSFRSCRNQKIPTGRWPNLSGLTKI